MGGEWRRVEVWGGDCDKRASSIVSDWNKQTHEKILVVQESELENSMKRHGYI